MKIAILAFLLSLSAFAQIPQVNPGSAIKAETINSVVTKVNDHSTELEVIAELKAQILELQNQINKNDTQSVYFGGDATCTTICATTNCTICNKVGTKITGVKRESMGIYLIEGIDGKKYICTGSAYVSPNTVPLLDQWSVSNSVHKRMEVNPPRDASYASVVCTAVKD